MLQPYLSNKPAWLQVLALFSLAICCASIASFIGFMVIKFTYGIDVLAIEAVLSDFSNPVTIPAYRILQICQILGVFILPPLLMAQFITGNALDVPGALVKPGVIKIGLGILIMLALQPTINFLAEWNSNLDFPDALGIEQWMKSSEKNAAYLTELFLDMKGIPDLILIVFIIGILTGIGEEFFFRATLQTIFQRFTGNKHVAILLAAFVFSALHMQFYGFFPRFLLGIALGYMFVWSGSIWVPVVAHAFNNSMAVVLSYLIKHQHVDKSIETIGIEGNLKPLLLSVVLSAFFIQQFYKRRIDYLD
ncbi:MAG: CPBP family intramembrane metalloprotease [Bacteroidia bacterium]|nr:CPBP family intramembrane metalloprotease [Bacteroidia bacterium]